MKVLVCPLDWGLGHATRCIPVIRELISRSHSVSIASNGQALTLLREEFPELSFYQITGYDPVYPVSRHFAWSMAKQVPKILKAIRNEHREIEELTRQQGFGLLISDNRYGCWSSTIPCVFITHQVNLPAPLPFSGIVNAIHHRYIRKFTACWVPDDEGSRSLAGSLSASNGIPVTRIGPLTRFNRYPVETRYDLLGLVSGPEPQRQILEDLLQDQFQKSGKRALIVRGLPGKKVQATKGQVGEVNHLSSADLNQAIMEASIVISRPGYSTVMDLAALGKKAVFIPTPGQPEQEYLGHELMRKGVALCVDQDHFDLAAALAESQRFSGFGNTAATDLLKQALDKFLPVSTR